jgi:hypothetical protein
MSETDALQLLSHLDSIFIRLRGFPLISGLQWLTKFAIGLYLWYACANLLYRPRY